MDSTDRTTATRIRFWRAKGDGIKTGNRISFSLRLRVFGRIYWIEAAL